MDVLNSSRAIGGDHGYAQGQALQNHVREPFVARRQHEQVSMLEVGIGIGLKPGEVDRLLKAKAVPLRLEAGFERALAQDGQLSARESLTDHRQSVQKHVKAFLIAKPSRRNETGAGP